MEVTRKDVLRQIGQILNNQHRYFLWVPLLTFGLGALAILTHQHLTKTDKYCLSEPCSICFAHPRTVVTEPCRHLVLCTSCSRMVGQCPLCRSPIASRDPIARYISL